MARESSNSILARRNLRILTLLVGALAVVPSAAEGNTTSLQQAQAAVEANLRTREGKAYDEQLGREFLQKQLRAVRQCKQGAGGDLASFWILMRLDADGAVKEVLLHPQTKIGTCARDTLLKSQFSRPPRDAYWVSVYLQISR